MRPLRRSLCSHNAELAEELERQFDELDDVLFGSVSVPAACAA